MIYITATMPPSLVTTFTTSISAPSIEVIRMATNRPEHRYIVRQVGYDQSMAVAKALMSSIRRDTSSKGILFVSSTEFGNQWEPDYPVYHSKLTKEAQDAAMSRWTGSESQWIVGTTALLHGVDLPNVDYVIFIGNLWGMMEFVQGAGRAGRRQQESVIYLLSLGTKTPTKLNDPQRMAALYNMIHEDNTCHRRHISHCMDGIEVSCNNLTNALSCGVCDPIHPLVTQLDAILSSELHSNSLDTQQVQSALTDFQAISSYQSPVLQATSMHQSPALQATSYQYPVPTSMSKTLPATVLKQSAMTTAKIDTNAKFVEEVADRLEKVSNYCPICWMMGNADFQPKEHNGEMHKCRAAGTFSDIPPFNNGYFKWKKGWKFESALKFDTWCGMPTDIIKTHGKHKDFPFGKICPYADIQQGVAWIIFHQSKLFKEMAQELNYGGEGGDLMSSERSQNLYRDWLCGKSSKGFGWNLMHVFVWGYNYRML